VLVRKVHGPVEVKNSRVKTGVARVVHTVYCVCGAVDGTDKLKHASHAVRHAAACRHSTVRENRAAAEVWAHAVWLWQRLMDTDDCINPSDRQCSAAFPPHSPCKQQKTRTAAPAVSACVAYMPAKTTNTCKKCVQITSTTWDLARSNWTQQTRSIAEDYRYTELAVGASDQWNMHDEP